MRKHSAFIHFSSTEERTSPEDIKQSKETDFSTINNMDSMKTIEALDKWATERGLSDNEVKLKRIELMCEAIDRPYECPVCSKRFKQRKHLLEHEREKHGSNVHDCNICQYSTSRMSNLRRHLRVVHNANEHPKRNTKIADATKFKLSTSTAQETVTTMARESEKIDATCNWCGKARHLLPGKKYCQTCGEGGRECKRCRRPLPERFYSRSVAVCDTCLKKRDNIYNTVGGAATKSALSGVVESMDIKPQDESKWDILLFLSHNKVNIEEHLSNKADSLEKPSLLHW